jgi:hypothetical protein
MSGTVIDAARRTYLLKRALDPIFFCLYGRRDLLTTVERKVDAVVEKIETAASRIATGLAAGKQCVDRICRWPVFYFHLNGPIDLLYFGAARVDWIMIRVLSR